MSVCEREREEGEREEGELYKCSAVQCKVRWCRHQQLSAYNNISGGRRLVMCQNKTKIGVRCQ